MKSSLALTGAFLLLSLHAYGRAMEGDFAQSLPSRTVASVEPADLTPHSSNEPALYELGLGMGGALDPHYPGSDQSRVIVLPFPFGVYRGRILQSDRRGTRAKLFNGGGFDISISGTGAFPVKSSDDIARAGMDDLGWMLQLGPKVRFDMKSWADGSVLRAGLSTRFAASASDFNTIDGRGFVLEPEIVYQKPDVFVERLDFFSSLSATFATLKYMDYIYGVPEAAATPERSAYVAHAGYLESVFQGGLSYRTMDGKHKFVVSTQVGSLAGASIEDSPLVKTRLDLTVGVAWVWTLFESEEKAAAID